MLVGIEYEWSGFDKLRPLRIRLRGLHGGFKKRQADHAVAKRLILFGEGRPGTVLPAAFDASFNEGDAVPAVLDVSVFAADAGKLFTGLPLAHIGFEAAMQAREGVVKRFRVTRRNRRLGHQVGWQILGQKTVAARARAAPIHAGGVTRQNYR